MRDFRLRLPDDVKAWLEADAKRHERSQNGHLIWLLRQCMNPTSEETGASVSQTSAPASRVIPEGT